MRGIANILSESLLKLSKSEVEEDSRFNMAKIIIFTMITSQEDPEVSKIMKLLTKSDFNYLKNVLNIYGVEFDNKDINDIKDWNEYINSLADCNIDSQIYNEIK